MDKTRWTEEGGIKGKDVKVNTRQLLVGLIRSKESSSSQSLDVKEKRPIYFWGTESFSSPVNYSVSVGAALKQKHGLMKEKVNMMGEDFLCKSDSTPSFVSSSWVPLLSTH